jgi:hypothetical protein
LLEDESSIGLVVVERFDDVVAIFPGVRVVVVVNVAPTVCVPRDIQPVTSPALAVVRRCEELIDALLPRVCGTIVDK